VLLDRGPALLANDPEHNLVFSAHLYDALSRQQIADLMQKAVDLELPFIVGEFANRSPANGCGANIDYLGIVAEAHARDIGWIAWSWGDDNDSSWWNGDCWEFDMTRTFAFDSLERWGKEVAVTDANSLANTAKRPASMRTGSCQ
jgi:mannan endo-1,4-beta-mannosidase